MDLDGKVDTGLLVLVHIVLQLRLPKLIEGDDDEGNKDVDKEKGKNHKEDNVEDAVLGPVPGNGTLVFVGRRHRVLENPGQVKSLKDCRKIGEKEL